MMVELAGAQSAESPRPPTPQLPCPPLPQTQPKVPCGSPCPNTGWLHLHLQSTNLFMNAPGKILPKPRRATGHLNLVHHHYIPFFDTHNSLSFVY